MATDDRQRRRARRATGARWPAISAESVTPNRASGRTAADECSGPLWADGTGVGHIDLGLDGSTDQTCRAAWTFRRLTAILGRHRTHLYA